MKKKLEIKITSIKQCEKIIFEEEYFECWKKYGLICFVYRFLPYGHWCGYVGVPKTHKLYGIHYSQKCRALSGKSPEEVFKVHGGITFSGKHRIWKIDDRWFFGFDTNHANDISCEMVMRASYPKLLLRMVTYKTKEFAIKETNKLARQLAKYSARQPKRLSG